MFDLDNTLYPADCNLFAEIDTRMGDFIAARFGVSLEEAQRMRKSYYYQYGTTLAGLMRLHDVCPNAFLDYVHDIDLSVIAPAPELGQALDALPGRKFVFTNGSRRHAEHSDRAAWTRWALRRCVRHSCRRVHSEAGRAPPMSASWGRTRSPPGAPPCSTILPHNLRTAHTLGMTTVLVACGQTDHPEHRAIAGWGELPSTSITAPTRSHPSSPASAPCAPKKPSAPRPPVPIAAIELEADPT